MRVRCCHLGRQDPCSGERRGTRGRGSSREPWSTSSTPVGICRRSASRRGVSSDSIRPRFSRSDWTADAGPGARDDDVPALSRVGTTSASRRIFESRGSNPCGRGPPHGQMISDSEHRRRQANWRHEATGVDEVDHGSREDLGHECRVAHREHGILLPQMTSTGPHSARRVSTIRAAPRRTPRMLTPDRSARRTRRGVQPEPPRLLQQVGESSRGVEARPSTPSARMACARNASELGRLQGAKTKEERTSRPRHPSRRA